MHLQIPRRLSKRAWKEAVLLAQGASPELLDGFLQDRALQSVRRVPFRPQVGRSYRLKRGRLVAS